MFFLSLQFVYRFLIWLPLSWSWHRDKQLGEEEVLIAILISSSCQRRPTLSNTHKHTHPHKQKKTHIVSCDLLL